ncbi:hypothetical protein BJ742DRAFT_866101 [Cladochytrium replicatum]|nr:hypothetical protein BJ742DRAFT_866101 [Cladochytrium replicatum]
MAQPKTTLDEVVRSLVKAAAGQSITTQVPDDGDFERHVAQLIMKEARKKETSYIKEGLRAYLDTPERPLRANTRFLSQVVKSTDQHNKVLIRQQQEQSDRAQRQLDRTRSNGRNHGRDREERHDQDRERRDKRERERRDDRARERRDDRDERDMDWEDSRWRDSFERESTIEPASRNPSSKGKSNALEARYMGSRSGHSERRSDRHSTSECLSFYKRKRYRESDDALERFQSTSPTVGKRPPSIIIPTNASKKSRTAPSDVTNPEEEQIHSEFEHSTHSDNDNVNIPQLRGDICGPSKVRGRGTTGSARLDKYFEEGYDPRLDMDNYDDENIHWYVHSLQEFIDKKKSEREGEDGKRKRNKKDKDKKHKKRKKHTEGSKRSKERSASESSEASFTCELPPPSTTAVPETKDE